MVDGVPTRSIKAGAPTSPWKEETGLEETGLLEIARASALQRHRRWPQRPMSRAIFGLMWLLRIYVVLMLAVVLVQISRLA